MKHLKTFDEINETTSATGGPAVSGGMGAVVSAQPSGLAGQTIGQNWASNGGVDGSGDIGVPYNPSGSNRVFQKLPMGKGHGAMTGKKSREKKLDLKALKMSFDKRKKNDIESGVSKPKKVMNFDDFSVRKDITSVKRLSEGFLDFFKKKENTELNKDIIRECLYDIMDEDRIKSDLSDNLFGENLGRRFHFMFKLPDIKQMEVTNDLTFYDDDKMVVTKIQFNRNNISDEEVEKILSDCEHNLKFYNLKVSYYICRGVDEGYCSDRKWTNVRKMLKNALNSDENNRNITIMIESK
jgi:hypothetical protein